MLPPPTRIPVADPMCGSPRRTVQERSGFGPRESYPEMPEEADCSYYLRTGICGCGSRCRYNHPRDHIALMGFKNPLCSLTAFAPVDHAVENPLLDPSIFLRHSLMGIMTVSECILPLLF
ncbi:zinc finger CCCH domain-containing protein 12-like [Rosa rugosa]|uniref:zinc finger CCCH domain-containing protein 12-like n=1 Tax=Rosa rugosa TaxID=74645 RepID=UPI002B400C7D|nr:zinc finger CCCH domain-containing protein 12-like [Rosa rugosa]